MDALPVVTDVEQLLADGEVEDLLRIWSTFGLRRTWQEAIDRAGDPAACELLGQDLDGWAAVTALEALRASRLLVDRLNGRRWYVMRDAREAGASWAEIGDAAGVSRQAAQQWYRQAIEAQEQHVGEMHDTFRARAVLDENL